MALNVSKVLELVTFLKWNLPPPSSPVSMLPTNNQNSGFSILVVYWKKHIQEHSSNWDLNLNLPTLFFGLMNLWGCYQSFLTIREEQFI